MGAMGKKRASAFNDPGPVLTIEIYSRTSCRSPKDNSEPCKVKKHFIPQAIAQPPPPSKEQRTKNNKDKQTNNKKPIVRPQNGSINYA